MDMAEKDDAEGRCPSCRTPYNKEKIVGVASKCERNKSLKRGKQKLLKVESIVGLPLNLVYEELPPYIILQTILVASVRSIQSVHGFASDGRPLKACFGTTKYCHALRFVYGAGITLWIWLRKMMQKGGVHRVVHLITRKR
ncbi:putative CCR4-NOT transcription complex subunit 4 [Helianthus annuus]|nr:putative CCR4-NOT transcription complex subunit 4 [Helianthus annuus]